MRFLVSLVLMVSFLVGCDSGLHQMGPTEYAVIFRNLPTRFGGGYSPKVVPAAQKVVLWPWDTLYAFDTSERYVSWGKANSTSPTTSVSGAHSDEGTGYVYTRARDGNEVAVAVTVVYSILPEPEKLLRLAREAALTNDDVRRLIVAVGRADIRTYMNHLKTSEFAEAKARYQAVRKVQDSMNARLEKYGIRIARVTLDDFQFERRLRDGSVDSSYQEKLTQIQKLTEDTRRELSRVQTVKATKAKELNEVQAQVNRLREEAEGLLEQAKLRADAYGEARKNEAEAILVKGKSEATGLAEQISALSGPGGQAMLKMELAKQLIQGNPKFVVMEKGEGVDVHRTDVNQLLKQLGVFEALREQPVASPTPQPTP